jgi:4-hydroxymandelate oxidase
VNTASNGVIDFDELERYAESILPRAAFDYFAGGSGTESTLRDNVAAWGRIRLAPHVLRDVSEVDLSTSVLGHPVSMPLLVAPVAYQRMAHDDGEAGTAAAAAKAGTIMVVSTVATQSMEDVAAAAPDAIRLFQLYVHADREMTLHLMDRAAAAGYRALVVTVDTPRLGNRLRDHRNQFRLPGNLSAANLRTSEAAGIDPSQIATYADRSFDASLSLDTLAWLHQNSSLPVLIKGVSRADDAVAAVQAGVAGVIVSNHGGRQLDGAVATADALPAIADAVGGDVPVLVDGGIRTGVDIVRALALGATAVLIGRPMLWGLTAGGADGVSAVLEHFREELTLALRLVGASSVAEVDRSLIWRP